MNLSDLAYNLITGKWRQDRDAVRSEIARQQLLGNREAR